MINVLKRSAFLLAVIIMIGSLPISASASDVIGFTVHPIIPENQQRNETAYFDLMVKPNTSQTLQIIVSNSSQKEIIVDVEAVSASTSSAGMINYTERGIKDDSLKYGFSEITEIENKEVRIPAGEERVVEAEVKLPVGSFDGIILGSICITDITNRNNSAEKENETENFSVKIENEYEYVIAAVLREKDTELEPKYELGEVYAMNENGRQIVVTEIRNSQPNLAKGLKYSGYITGANSEEKLFEVIDAEVSFAPNSVMSYKFRDSVSSNIPYGDYVFKGSIADGEKTWDFSKEFEIKNLPTETVNSPIINQIQNAMKNNNTLLLVGITAILILLLVVIAVYLIRRNKKAEK